MRSGRAKAIGFAVGVSLLGAVFTASSDASASSAEVSGTGKGIAGGALLGAEVGFLGLAAAGSKNPTLYYTIPPILAIGGGVGGYFIEHNSDNAHVPVYMLAGGMALIIPTVVITLSATHYTPTSEDATPVDATPSAPSATGTVNIGGGGSGSSGTTAPAPAKRKPETSSLRSHPMPVALINVANENTTTFSVGVPMVSMRPMYTRTEVAMYGVQQKYEFHAPVVALAF